MFRSIFRSINKPTKTHVPEKDSEVFSRVLGWFTLAMVIFMFLIVVALVLVGCGPQVNPLRDGPVATGPTAEQVEPGGNRTLLLTQRAPEGIPISDVYLTLIAQDESGLVDISVVVDGEVTSAPAFVNDDRCFEIRDSELVTCQLGDLAAGEAAEPVAINALQGVSVSCNASGFVGGEVAGYRPLFCLRERD